MSILGVGGASRVTITYDVENIPIGHTEWKWFKFLTILPSLRKVYTHHTRNLAEVDEGEYLKGDTDGNIKLGKIDEGILYQE